MCEHYHAKIPRYVMYFTYADAHALEKAPKRGIYPDIISAYLSP